MLKKRQIIYISIFFLAVLFGTVFAGAVIKSNSHSEMVCCEITELTAMKMFLYPSFPVSLKFTRSAPELSDSDCDVNVLNEYTVISVHSPEKETDVYQAVFLNELILPPVIGKFTGSLWIDPHPVPPAFLSSRLLC